MLKYNKFGTNVWILNKFGINLYVCPSIPGRSKRLFYHQKVKNGLNLLEFEVGHSPPSSAEFKDEWSYTSAPSLHLNDLHKNSICILYVFIHSVFCLTTGPKPPLK
jgi:hypothetical protein